MDQSKLLHRAFLVALNCMSGIGAKTSLKILSFCQKYQLSENDFLGNYKNNWQELNLNEKTIESIKKFNKEHTLSDNLAEILASGLQVLTFEDKAYPELLLASEDYPTVLYIKSRLKIGERSWCEIFKKTISVVGTRKMSSY